MPKITLRDVASRAGVSVTTVSNVTRGWPYISDATRHKVQCAILELGYSPDPLAQGLRTGRTQVLAFIVPDIANLHFAAMVSTVEDVAQEHGYSVLVLNTHEDPGREAECIQRITRGWGDGILIVQAADSTPIDTHQLPIPLVAVDRVPTDFEGASCSVDNSLLTTLVVRHLYALGHRRIAHLSGPQAALTARERVARYLALAEELGLEFRFVTSNTGTWSSEEGYRAMFELLDLPEIPTAVFASNDRLAIGAAHAICERGLRIPDDISLVGVDDIESSRYLNPPLTTVRQPLDAMARAAVDLLLGMLDGRQSPARSRLSLAPALIVRQSTSAPRPEGGPWNNRQS